MDKVEEIKEALSILGLTPFITFKEIKNRYFELSKKYHPDICKDKEKMISINKAYSILKQYVDDFRFSFDDKEIHKQYPQKYHADRFRF